MKFYTIKKNQLFVILFLIVIVVICYKMMIATQCNAKPLTKPKITVYRSESCACCKKWITHLEKNQFEVHDVIVTQINTIKNKFNIPQHLSSCHTARVNRYIIEGHVPADYIHALLKKNSDIKGLTVPGMPVGTPGMEQGNRKDAYDVLAFQENGTTHKWTLASPTSF
jgi:hypothetical protein